MATLTIQAVPEKHSVEFAGYTIDGLLVVKRGLTPNGETLYSALTPCCQALTFTIGKCRLCSKCDGHAPEGWTEILPSFVEIYSVSELFAMFDLEIVPEPRRHGQECSCFRCGGRP